jgi:hypothetical protein
MHTGGVPFAANMLVVGPLIAFGVIAALAAVLRWAFDSDVARTQEKIFGEQDFGLLSVAGVVESADQAQDAQQLLADVGIRATTSVTRDGQIRILVFASELETARRVVGDTAI